MKFVDSSDPGEGVGGGQEDVDHELAEPDDHGRHYQGETLSVMRFGLCSFKNLKEFLHLADRKLVLPLLKTGQSLLLVSLQSANGFEGTGGEWRGD